MGTIIGIYKPSAVECDLLNLLSSAILLDGKKKKKGLYNDLYVFLLQVTWLETDLFTVGLGFLMLSMGLTLTFDDFKRCLRNPWTVRLIFSFYHHL